MNRLIALRRARVLTATMSEATEQSALIKWCRQHPVARRIFHIANGEKRRAITAAKLKRMGVLPGVADLFLPVARPPYHGLFIEMKDQGGRQKESQKEFQNDVIKEGYKYVICESCDDGVKQILIYLSKRV